MVREIAELEALAVELVDALVCEERAVPSET